MYYEGFATLEGHTVHHAWVVIREDVVDPTAGWNGPRTYFGIKISKKIIQYEWTRGEADSQPLIERVWAHPAR